MKFNIFTKMDSNLNMKRSRNHIDTIVKRSKSKLIDDIKSGNLTMLNKRDDCELGSSINIACVEVNPTVIALLCMSNPPQQDVPIRFRPILEKYTSGYYSRRNQKTRLVIEKRLPAQLSTTKSLVSAYLVKDIFDWMCYEFRLLK